MCILKDGTGIIIIILLDMQVILHYLLHVHLHVQKMVQDHLHVQEDYDKNTHQVIIADLMSLQLFLFKGCLFLYMLNVSMVG